MTPKSRPRCFRRASARGIPCRIVRAVWVRDGGHCAFVSDSGRRCTGRRLLEITPIAPLAEEIGTRVEDFRLLCGGHVEYEKTRALDAALKNAMRKTSR